MSFFLPFPVFCMCVFFFGKPMYCSAHVKIPPQRHIRHVGCKPSHRGSAPAVGQRGRLQRPLFSARQQSHRPPVTAQFTKPMPIMLHQNHQRNRHRLWSAPDAFASMGCRSAGAVQYRANPTSLLRCSSSIADCCNAFAKFLHA